MRMMRAVKLIVSRDDLVRACCIGVFDLLEVLKELVRLLQEEVGWVGEPVGDVDGYGVGDPVG